MFGVISVVVALILLFIAVITFFVRHRSRNAVRQAVRADPSVVTDGFGYRALSDKMVQYACGHKGHRDFVGVFFGEELKTEPEMLKRRKFCPDCLIAALRSRAIRCALCGFAIFVGEPVALYGGPRSSFRREGITEHDGQYVGCLRWGCCPCGGFFAGHWDGQKVIPAFANGGSAAAEAMRTGQTVCVNIETEDGKDAD